MFVLLYFDCVAGSRIHCTGADISAAGKYGYTPIHCTAEDGHVAAMEALRSAGEWPDHFFVQCVESCHGRTCVSACRRRRQC